MAGCGQAVLRRWGLLNTRSDGDTAVFINELGHAETTMQPLS